MLSLVSLCRSLAACVHLFVLTAQLILKSEASVRVWSKHQQQWENITLSCYALST